MARYLTKSRFKLARECPTKLYYTGKENTYANQKNEDSFLLALAEGGYQVGTLAQAYYPSGHSITTLDHNEALRQTDDLLKQESVIIFEAAFRCKSLFVRVDIAIKKGNELELVEVKSKSNDSRGTDSMLTKNSSIVSAWRSYIEDIAFQKHVVSNARPDFDVYAYLMTADKDKLCPSDGLNQKFKIITDSNGRKIVKQTDSLSTDELNNWILRIDNVDELCDIVFEEKYSNPDPLGGDLGFEELADILSQYYEKDVKVKPCISSACAKCEFRTKPDEEKAGKLSGFKECWHEILGWTDSDFAEPNLFDIGRLHATHKKSLIESKLLKIKDISSSIINQKEPSKPGLSQSERQVLQIEKVHDNDNDFWIDEVNLKNEINSWKFPLHFIDFETAMTAIPFNKGRRPYEEIAFQFSHHIVYDDGTIEHRGEFLETTPGVFPNYAFLRALRDELSCDNGSIFRYASHENTYLQKSVHRFYARTQLSQMEMTWSNLLIR